MKMNMCTWVVIEDQEIVLFEDFDIDAYQDRSYTTHELPMELQDNEVYEVLKLKGHVQ